VSTSAGAGSGATVGARTRIRPGIWLAAAAVATFLLVFLVLPVARVFYAAFVEADGSLTVGHFAAFFGQGLMREAFFNSLFVALMSALFAPTRSKNVLPFTWAKGARTVDSAIVTVVTLDWFTTRRPCRSVTRLSAASRPCPEHRGRGRSR
jgi:ABC-type spermidine/putrescine transport system permease subunit I